MKISIFGLGYVGFISGVCLAESGHEVIGVDVNPQKVELINSGVPPVIEEQVEQKLSEVYRSGQLKAIINPAEAIYQTDLSLVCVGTPSLDNGDINLTYLKRVCRQIGEAIREKDDFHVVVIRSTVIPGSTDDALIPIMENYSGKKAGKDFGVGYNPEFLRESSSIWDYYNPPKIVVGGTDEKAIERTLQIYDNLEAPVFKTTIKVAEMVKYVDNIFHALKITFANEMGNLGKKLSIDSYEVMDIFTQDTKLNISPAYLKPGFAFGGSCLPKDIRAFLYKSKICDLEMPLISSILRSNEQQVRFAFDMIQKNGSRNIGIFGLSFKPGTDDLRESPMVTLVEMLIGKGYKVKIHDQNVLLAKVMGSNKEYIERVIPHISKLMTQDVDEILAHGRTLVFGHNNDFYRSLIDRLKPGHFIIDLVRILEDYRKLRDQYKGISWA